MGKPAHVDDDLMMTIASDEEVRMLLVLLLLYMHLVALSSLSLMHKRMNSSPMWRKARTKRMKTKA